MRYRGHTLTTHYLPGADFKITSAGSVEPRKPTSKDIDYVRAEPDDGGTAVNSSSIEEAKEFIRSLERHDVKPVQAVAAPLATPAGSPEAPRRTRIRR